MYLDFTEGTLTLGNLKATWKHPVPEAGSECSFGEIQTYLLLEDIQSSFLKCCPALGGAEWSVGLWSGFISDVSLAAQAHPSALERRSLYGSCVHRGWVWPSCPCETSALINGTWVALLLTLLGEAEFHRAQGMCKGTVLDLRLF